MACRYLSTRTFLGGENYVAAQTGLYPWGIELSAQVGLAGPFAISRQDSRHVCQNARGPLQGPMVHSIRYPRLHS